MLAGGLAGALALAVLWATRPARAPAGLLAGLEPDAARGEWLFDAAGCAGCHAAPESEGGADAAARLVLAGGRALASPFGTFRAPNISPDPQAGIGGWSARDLYDALHFGTSPEGRHYYPAFPYTTYVNMTAQDVVDLHAYLMRLPADATPSQPHALRFPYSIRAGLGLWKALYLRPGWVVEVAPDDALARRGRYLVEALGHCAECHTPRGPLGGMQRGRWLAGAAHPSGRGRIPNITPARLDWSEADIAAYLASGFTPDFDTAGGDMAEVVANTARLRDGDRAAIARYLRQVPAVE